MPILALHVEAEGGLAVLPEKRDICRLSEHSFRTCWGGAAQQFLYDEATVQLCSISLYCRSCILVQNHAHASQVLLITLRMRGQCDTHSR